MCATFFCLVSVQVCNCIVKAPKGNSDPRPLPLLTSPPLLQPPLSLLLPEPRLLLLLLLATFVKVFHHHAHEHVEHKEADDEEEGDEEQQHPGVVVPYWLWREVTEGEKRRGEEGRWRGDREEKKR